MQKLLILIFQELWNKGTCRIHMLERLIIPVQKYELEKSIILKATSGLLDALDLNYVA